MTLISKLICSENTSFQVTFSSKPTNAPRSIEGKSPASSSERSFIGVISLLLESLFDISPKAGPPEAQNGENVDSENMKNKTFCVYNCVTLPSISIEDYLKRIQYYLKLQDECYLLSLVYLDKLIQRTSLIITSQNIHKLLLTSLTLACKFLDDDWESNDYMAKLGGIPLRELNLMELHFLKDIKYELFIDHKTLVFYQKHIRDYFSRTFKFPSTSNKKSKLEVS